MNPLFPDVKLTDLFNLVRFEANAQTKRVDGQLWLGLPSGLPMFTTVAVTDKLSKWIAENMIRDGGNIDKNYFLEVQLFEREDVAHVYIKYQDILGSQLLCVVPRTQLLDFLAPPVPGDIDQLMAAVPEIVAPKRVRK
jgi:hypothetical protein